MFNDLDVLACFGTLVETAFWHHRWQICNCHSSRKVEEDVVVAVISHPLSSPWHHILQVAESLILIQTFTVIGLTSFTKACSNLSGELLQTSWPCALE